MRQYHTGGVILPFAIQFCILHLPRLVVYKNVRYRSYELTIPNDRRATHKCGQKRTTNFNGIFMKLLCLG